MLRTTCAMALVLAVAGGCGQDASAPADDAQLSLVAPAGSSIKVDVERNGPRMGGQWATGQMILGTGMLGAGRLPANGMIFTSTTR